MTKEPGHAFSISDGLLLIVGIAVSMGAVRAACGNDDFLETLSFPRPSLTWSFFGNLMEVMVIFGVPVLASWTPFCLLLQAKKPRHRWGRLRKQPGFVASLLATSITILAIVAVVTLDFLFDYRRAGWFVNRYAKAYVMVCLLNGAAVFWSWAGLWVSGNLRCISSWKDRLGLVNGAGWIVLGLNCAYFVYEKL